MMMVVMKLTSRDENDNDDSDNDVDDGFKITIIMIVIKFLDLTYLTFVLHDVIVVNIN